MQTWAEAASKLLHGHPVAHAHPGELVPARQSFTYKTVSRMYKTVSRIYQTVSRTYQIVSRMYTTVSRTDETVSQQT